MNYLHNNQPEDIAHLPLGVEHLDSIVERTYDEGSAHQWVRETIVNSHEAMATKMLFGVEWQAVSNTGIYRRFIADNGIGMSERELLRFFSGIGAGTNLYSDHPNFGFGAKVSLFPWNRAGVIVMSRKDEVDSMIRVKKIPVSENGQGGGQYVLIGQSVDQDGYVVDPSDPEFYTDSFVYRPYEDLELGLDCQRLLDGMMKTFKTPSGAVILLLGNSEKYTDHTILGDSSPSRSDESDPQSIAKYVSGRFWDSNKPTGNIAAANKDQPPIPEIKVDAMGSKNPSTWPGERPQSSTRSAASGFDGARTARSGKYYAMGGIRSASAGVTHSGIVPLSDGTRVHWYYREGHLMQPEFGGQGYGRQGYIAVMLHNELYHLTNHHATYTGFGISGLDPTRAAKNGKLQQFNQRVWLIIEPPPGTVKGKTDRNGLNRTTNGGGGSSDMPWDQWKEEFNRQIPKPILDAMHNNNPKSSSPKDRKWMKRVFDRIGRRYPSSKNAWQTQDNGEDSTTPDTTATGKRRKGKKSPNPQPNPQPNPRPNPRPNNAPGTKPAAEGVPNTGSEPGGPAKAKSVESMQQLPEIIWELEEVITGGDQSLAWQMGIWREPGSQYPNGAVLLNVDHPWVIDQIAWHQNHAVRKDSNTQASIKDTVKDAFEEEICSKIVHVASLVAPGQVTRKMLHDELRSPAAITTALAGFASNDALAGPRFGPMAKMRKKDT